MTAIVNSTRPWSALESAAGLGGNLLVFADDWGRHPSSCQHLASQLLDRHPIHWVNTIGTRTPRLDWTTLKRGFEKIGQWLRPPRHLDSRPANLRVHNPRMWPWCGTTLGRRLNRRLLVRQLTPIIENMAEPPIAVTTIPIVAELMGALPVKRWIYYCVDDFGQWPGLDQSTLRDLEWKVVNQADTIIAVSEHLQQRIRAMGRSSHLLTHGVDMDHWSKPAPPLADLADLPRPLVVFWGVVDRRMDIEYVTRLGVSLTEGTIVLAGPSNNHDPVLDRTPRVHQIGAIPFAQLPALAHEASVLIMPYADLPVTRAMQPLKLKEYLATGKPVVVRDLPANREWRDCLDLADSAEGFVHWVRQRLTHGLPVDQQMGRARLMNESWQAKANDFKRWVFADTESGAAM